MCAMKAWRTDPPGFPDVKHVWQRNRCVGTGTIAVYRYWISRFLEYCRTQGLDARQELTCTGAQRFARWWRSAGSPRRGRVEATFKAARSALRSWSFALQALGNELPRWISPPPVPTISPIMAAFSSYLREVRGNPPCTIHKKLVHINMFSLFCRRRRRQPHRARLRDIDEFIVWCRQRYARTTVSDICCTLRSYQRFLCASGRVSRNLAGSIIAPLVRTAERPHRALPWEKVQRILVSIDQSTPTGRRDYALLLMMSVYGLGAGEIIGLTLDDIKWSAKALRIVRPKNGVEFLLPLLPPVARALAGYLRCGRPQHVATRHLFVTMRTPYKRLACSVTIRHILHTAAARAGVSAPFMGTHVLRHTHACRQLELGASPKIIGDILGHRDPDSTSAYLRVATARLRELALPVPV